MAAIHAARVGVRVVLLETTRDGGRKILISGGGRCKILPSELDPSRFVSESPAPLVRRLLGTWPLAEQRAFFEADLGIPLALEAETGKLFPLSNRARQVRDALVAAAVAAGTEILFGARVGAVEPDSGRWRLTVGGHEPLRAEAVIVATGGLSVPATGSDGAGLELARRLGHLVRQTYPALTPLTAEPAVHAALAGLSLTVTLSARVQRRRIVARGGFLFTHRGYSGPAVLDLSHLAVRSRLRGEVPRQSLRVQWTDADRDTWDRRLQLRTPQSILAALRESLPGRLAGRLILEAGVDPARQLAQLLREERRQLVTSLTEYDLPWTGDEGYRKAEVTGGGLALEEVDPRTLESRRHPGLYFCGEVLDAFGPIGGYNFAWAWATGRAAGLGAASRSGKS
jgi:predicted Rossmann fold flavoprotein